MGAPLARAPAPADACRTTSRILLVDDDPGAIRMMAGMLADLGDLSFATSGIDSLRLAREWAPDLILLDADMPDASGFQVCEALKADPALATVPVIFVTSHVDIAFEVASFESGAADFIAKPVNAAQLRARVKAQLQRKISADLLRLISTTDALTGIANRRRFDAAIDLEWRRARRGGQPLCLLMIDVDHFKLFNDHSRHPAGDDCLRAVAGAIVSASARPADLAPRHGGEEFMVLLPDTPRLGARHKARAVADAVRRLDLPHAASTTARRITVSIGIACYDNDSECWLGAIADTGLAKPGPGCSALALGGAADSAMYSAKRGGRAQVHLLDIADAQARPHGLDVQASSIAMGQAAPIAAP
jgi:diguanylate cyclase (GGDEF)-like protein